MPERKSDVVEPNGLRTISNNNAASVVFRVTTFADGQLFGWTIALQTVPLTAAGEKFSVSEGPLPAALPLFATGLGALGLLGWLRRRSKRRTRG